MRVTQFGFIGGWKGTARTIREMRHLVENGKKHPTVIWLAGRLASRRPKDDYLGQAKELFKFVKKYIHYVRDPKGVELLRSPFWALYYRAGDCDCQAVLFSALAQAIGFDTQFKTVKADAVNPAEFSHVFSQLLVPGKGWLSADTIVPKARLGWETEKQFGSQLWRGGAAMIGDLAALGEVSPYAIDAPTEASAKKEPGPFAQFLQGALSNAWQSAQQSFMGSAVNGVNNLLGTTEPPPPPPEPAVPAWLLPVGILGAAGLGVFLVTRMKRAS